MIEPKFPDADTQWPKILATKASPLQYQLELAVPESIHWFKGHFPGNPILPGVVQIHWAQFFSRKLLHIDSIKGVKNIKFNNMILPNSHITLMLTAQPEKHRVRFRYSQRDDTCSSGIIEGLFA